MTTPLFSSDCLPLTVAAPTHERAPRLSVVMGVKRVDGYLQPAIASILAQSFTDFEFLILVDAADGAVVDAVKALAKEDGRIRVIESPPLGGFAFALNLGISLANGTYIARMDADDLSRPERFREQVAYLDQHPAVGVVGCRVQLIDADSQAVHRAFPYFQSDPEIRRVLPFRNPLPHPALIFRKTALLAVQGYKYGHTSEDHEMFIRMARDPGMEFFNLDQTLFEYRRHGLQATRLGPRMRVSFIEISGFLFSEFLATHSIKYLFGMWIIHPWVRGARMVFRKWSTGSTN